MIPKLSKFGKSMPAKTGPRARKKKLPDSIIVSAVFIFFLASTLGFFIYQNVSMERKRSVLEDRLREIQAQANEFSIQGAILEANVADTQSEEYQEKILREQGLYQKEGEQVITILPPEEGSEEPEQPKEKERVWLAPLEILKRIFGGGE